MSYRKYLMTDDVPPSELYKTVKIDTDPDTISRAKAIEAINARRSVYSGMYGKGLSMAVDTLRELPPAQPERIKGHWIKISPANIYECSECGKSVMTNDICAYDFCHGCGADMREEKEK